MQAHGTSQAPGGTAPQRVGASQSVQDAFDDRQRLALICHTTYGHRRPRLECMHMLSSATTGQRRKYAYTPQVQAGGG